MVQLSHSYMTTGKTIALTRWAFVGKVMSLLFNMLSRLVIVFLSSSKRLLKELKLIFKKSDPNGEGQGLLCTRDQRTHQEGAYEPSKQHTFLESPLSFIFPTSEPGF